MTFKEMLNDDLKVFFNLAEFAEIHRIDGTEMAIIIDEDALEELKKTHDTDYDGIYKSVLLFYVKKSDIGGKPALNSLIEVDDETYQVIGASGNDDVIKIILGRYED
ncbi:hypothetical protein QA584_17320 [Anaerocolumna sp. AGMB13025]|uniref:hypothetical protein n=1 Tax=Anaerocolumna sp. AGMB13025 TaxID=3039116 RepID=UPI00241C501D|nr:hypothetical protein [Anaerocolumna sp. AGMB13025]WFR55361.1 hypothetical protein QA584_17320 [Anaerocolumna sp. AGMB13025]